MMGEISRKKIADGGNTFLTKQNNSVIWHDADIILQHGYAGANFTNRQVEIQFNVFQDWILSQHTMGDNQFKVKEEYEVDRTSKNISNGVDGNDGVNAGFYTWQPSYYKLSNPQSVEKIIFNSPTNTERWTTKTNIYFSDKFINLKTIIGSSESGSQLVNFNWLSKLPTLQDIRVSVFNQGGGDFTGFSNTDLRYIELRRVTASVESIVSAMPSTLNYLILFIEGNGVALNLANYYNNVNRMGLHVYNRQSNQLANITYTGGGIFPTIISEEPDRPITWILRTEVANGTFLSPIEAARFIVDFANQVTAVTLVNKRIHFNGTVPDNSYTDPSKPIYKNYIDAYDYVTNTLGITIY